jgi:hypothetical protein
VVAEEYGVDENLVEAIAVSIRPLKRASPESNTRIGPRIKKAPPSVRKRGRRVLILGAGASATCGIAVSRDILRASMQQLADRRAADAEKVHTLLSYLYPDFSEDLANYPNVEDFLNLVEMAKEFHTEKYILSKRWSSSKLQDAMDTTLRAITEYIWGFMAADDRRRVLTDLARELVRPGDVVVSFNWDFVIDLILEHLKDAGPVYSFSSRRDSVVLLKPHGSIDWFDKEKVPRKGEIAREMLHRARGLYFYPYFRLAQNPDLLKQLTPFIVPPLSIKKFDGFLKGVWRDVYRALASAQEIYIIGYSLPREDQFAKLVIGRAVQRNNARRKRGRRKLLLTVINPDENVMRTFHKLGGDGTMRFYPTSLQDYVLWLKAQHEEES